MAKKKNNTPTEDVLLLPPHPACTPAVPVVDTHTHLLTTFSTYKRTYKPGKHETVWDFARAMYEGRGVEAIVDVWCEAPVLRQWKEIADSALTEQLIEQKWGGLQYYFVMGTSSDVRVFGQLDSIPGWWRQVFIRKGLSSKIFSAVYCNSMTSDTKQSCIRMTSNEICA